MVKPWYMEQVFSKPLDHLSDKDLHKLKRFYMVQLELSLALLEAKPLGICKTTTLPREELNTLKRYSSDVSKEML